MGFWDFLKPNNDRLPALGRNRKEKAFFADMAYLQYKTSPEAVLVLSMQDTIIRSTNDKLSKVESVNLSNAEKIKSLMNDYNIHVYVSTMHDEEYCKQKINQAAFRAFGVNGVFLAKAKKMAVMTDGKMEFSHMPDMPAMQNTKEAICDYLVDKLQIQKSHCLILDESALESKNWELAFQHYYHVTNDIHDCGHFVRTHTHDRRTAMILQAQT